MNNNKSLYKVPYYLWILIFVLLPLILLFSQSLITTNKSISLQNYINFFTSFSYISMTINSIFIATLVTLLTFIISYPLAYFISKLKYKNILMLLVILPTWINLMLKTYAFIGLFAHDGSLNNILNTIGFGRQQILFTSSSFIIVAAYIQIPFMIMPIFNAINKLNKDYINAARDLGANDITILYKIIIPLTKKGIRAGIQSVFIPTLSLFMIARLIGGEKVITLGTAVEENFLVNQNWGMGSTIGIILIIAMAIMMFITRDKKKRKY